MYVAKLTRRGLTMDEYRAASRGEHVPGKTVEIKGRTAADVREKARELQRREGATLNWIRPRGREWVA